jgi:hypothetical protein
LTDAVERLIPHPPPLLQVIVNLVETPPTQTFGCALFERSIRLKALTNESVRAALTTPPLWSFAVARVADVAANAPPSSIEALHVLLTAATPPQLTEVTHRGGGGCVTGQVLFALLNSCGADAADGGGAEMEGDEEREESAASGGSSDGGGAESVKIKPASLPRRSDGSWLN